MPTNDIIDFHVRPIIQSQLKLTNRITFLLAMCVSCHVCVVEAVDDVGYKIYADWVCGFNIEGGLRYRDLSRIGQYRAREMHCRRYGSIRGCKWSDPRSKVDWSEMRSVDEMSCRLRRYTPKGYILCKRYMQCPE